MNQSSEASHIIKQLREQLGLIQRELAEQTGIKQPQLARIESGKQSPRLDTITRIASNVGYRIEIKLVPLHESDQLIKQESL